MLFFSRRTYNAQKKKFTDNPAAKTRYVTMEKPSGQIRKGSMVNQGDWLKLVQAEGGKKDVLICVHGFNTSQKDMLNNLARLTNGVRANGYKGAVIGFDWPSNGALLAYDSDRRDAKEVAPHLIGDGLLPLLGMSPKPRVHIIAHSMGALLVLRAFSDFGDSAGPGIWGADQVMFTAADIDGTWLEKGAWGGLVLKQRAKRFTNYYNSEDRVLQLSGGLINGGRSRAGRAGMPRLVTKGHWDIYCEDQYLRHVPKSRRTMTNSHRWLYKNDGFYMDLAQTLAGKDAKTIKTRKKTNTADLALLTKV